MQKFNFLIAAVPLRAEHAACSEWVQIDQCREEEEEELLA
jgi:hypothetical protein